MRNITKLGIALSLTCLIAAGILVPVNFMTRERIEENKTAAERQAIRMMLPPEVDDKKDFVEKQIGDVVFTQFFNASDEVVALIAKASGRGYGGEVVVMVSVDKDGRIGKVVVTEHKETPGIGSSLTDRVRSKLLSEAFSGSGQDQEELPPNDFLDQFSKPELSELAETSNFSFGDDRIRPVVGATVTSRAINSAVEKISRTFAENREILFK